MRVDGENLAAAPIERILQRLPAIVRMADDPPSTATNKVPRAQLLATACCGRGRLEARRTPER